MAEQPLRAYTGDESYIFVTYSHDDSDLVYPQLRWLQDLGFNVVWDEGISPGAVWRNEIAESIRSCSLLLYLTTPNSVSSKHCTREVNFALDEYHRPVLAVHLIETALPDALALSLSDRQAIYRHTLEPEDYERKLVSAIATYLEQPVPAIQSPLRVPTRNRSRQFGAAFAILGSLLIGIIGTWFAMRPDTTAARLQTRIPIELPDGVAMPLGRSNFVSIDRNGERVFFVGENSDGRRQVYGRRLDELSSQPIPGTEDTPEDQLLSAYPSPDGKSIALGYRSGTIKKISSSGGSSTLVAESPAFRAPRLHWGPQNRIAFPYDLTSLVQVLPSGGDLDTVVASEESVGVSSPYFSLDGQSLYFTRITGKDFSVMAKSLDEPAPTRLVSNAFDPKITSSGHLLFSRNNAVWALALSTSDRTVSGTPVAVLQDVQAGSYLPGRYPPQYAVADNGTLVYQPSKQNDGINLVWVDRQGRKEPAGSLNETMHDPRLSPDQRQVVFTSGGNGELWTYSFDTGLSTRRWKSGSPVLNSAWSPDGSQIAFSDWQSGKPNIYIADLTGEEPVRRLTTSDLYQWANGWTSDGESLLLQECESFIDSCDIRLLPINSQAETQTIVGSAANEIEPTFSPDYKHIAYISDTSGFSRIVIQPFPVSGRDRLEVPLDGCSGLLWSPTGDELFGLCNGLMMSIPVHQGPVLSFGQPQVLFPIDSTIVWDPAKARFFDVSADGGRFLMIGEGERESATSLVVVLNWLDEVERLVPTE